MKGKDKQERRPRKATQAMRGKTKRKDMIAIDWVQGVILSFFKKFPAERKAMIKTCARHNTVHG